jgi:predicted glycogen debranching enzyme
LSLNSKNMLTKDKEIVQQFDTAINYEWLETNGLGGWSGTTIIGANTRRYHGLLVASIVPPVERMVLLSKLDETIVVDGNRYELGCNQYAGDTIQPRGHKFLRQFSKDIVPSWVYEAGGIQLQKNITMLHGENTVVVSYEVLKAPTGFTLELLPLVAARGYHSLQKEGDRLHWDVDFANGIFHNQPNGATHLYISVPGSGYQHNPRWFKDFNYTIEQYRGLDHSEDLLNHGVLSAPLKEGDRIEIIISTENPEGRDAQALVAKEILRRRRLLFEKPDNELFHQLLLAADQFIVRRGDNLKTMIAGYHWFTDWGRDTMISLSGICLSTGRFEDAKNILRAFAASVSEGMLPNRFQDNGEPPEYNNVDGTLWYFIAVYKYLQATNDKEFVLTEILPVLKEIIDWHFKGTRYNIHVDDDGLLYAGETGQQLTWMDARIGDWVVTPRMGKPVEIQALWYNALKIFSNLLAENGQEQDAAIVTISADKCRQSFTEKFWYANAGYLYDVIDENNRPDPTLRPNQLLAISLPFELISEAKAQSVLTIIGKELYTPVGLRTLPVSDKRYIGKYGGDQWHRDSAYHQGTVWSWLLGPYVDALMKTHGDKTKIEEVIDGFRHHLTEGCIGSVSEIFDGDYPHHPRGCIAQAWGVAEWLRVLQEYALSAT